MRATSQFHSSNLIFPNNFRVPSRERIHIPPNGKFGKSSTQNCRLEWDMFWVVPSPSNNSKWRFRSGSPSLKIECHPGGNWHPGRGDNPRYVIVPRWVIPPKISINLFPSLWATPTRRSAASVKTGCPPGPWQCEVSKRPETTGAATGDIWVFPKIGVPPNHPFVHRVFHYKPSILGYPYFWKHPYNTQWFDIVGCFRLIDLVF